MKFSFISKITREDFHGIPDKLVTYLNSLAGEIGIGLRGALTFRDNILGSVIEYKFTHGVEVAIQNPLNSRPDGLQLVWTENKNRADIVWDFNQKNEVLITVNFAAGAGTSASCRIYVWGV